MAETKVIKDEGFLISNSIKGAWSIFKEEWISFYVIQLLPFLIAILYTVALEPMGGKESTFGMVWSFVYIFVQIIISMGVVKAYLNMTRGKKITSKTFTGMLPQVLKYLGAQFLLMLIVLGGLLLFIIPGFYFSLKYMFTPYLVIDKKMGPIEALKASAKMTEGVKWDLIGFLAATTVLIYAGALALLVGLFITIPVGTLAYVLLYNKLVKRIE